MNIIQLRAKIDEVDNQIIQLLEKRISLAIQIGRLRGSAKQDESRELDVIRRLAAANEESRLSDQAIAAIWQCIFEHSRKAQASSLATIKS